jgi:uncharacterized Fe-S radical SAM superfamily protein PflX
MFVSAAFPFASEVPAISVSFTVILASPTFSCVFFVLNVQPKDISFLPKGVGGSPRELRVK